MKSAGKKAATDGGSGAPEPLPKDVVTVYTTRCDTLFGATYMVMSPEHPLVAKWLEDGTVKNADDVKAYQKKAASKSDLERTDRAGTFMQAPPPQALSTSRGLAEFAADVCHIVHDQADS